MQQRRAFPICYNLAGKCKCGQAWVLARDARVIMFQGRWGHQRNCTASSMLVSAAPLKHCHVPYTSHYNTMTSMAESKACVARTQHGYTSSALFRGTVQAYPHMCQHLAGYHKSLQAYLPWRALAPFNTRIAILSSRQGTHC